MADINLGVGGANSATGGFDIANSVKFEADNTEYMKFTSSQSGSDLKRMAFNIWLKRTELGTAQTFMLLGNGGSNSTRLDLGFDSSDRLQIRNVNSNWRLTTQVFRDTSAWYHLFFQFNTLETTADDRIKVWVNGNLIAIGDYTTVNDPGYNATLGFNRNYSNILGGRELEGSNSQMFSGYIAQVYGSGGTPPSVTDFGEFDEDTGIWKPIDISEISPPEPINGFFLDFTDASDLGNDASGNNNNWTLNNITAADQATDTPTNNFCTMNPLLQSSAAITPMTEGATFIIGASSSTNWESRFGTFAVTSGKWYTELKADGAKFTNNIMVGFCGTEYTLAQSVNHLVYGGEASNPGAVAVYSYNGNIYGGTGNHGFKIYDGDIVAMMLDADNGAMYFKRLAGPNSNSSEGTITFSQDGTNTADPTSGASKTGAQLVDWDGATVVAVSVGKNTGGAEMNFGGYNIISNTQSYTDANGYGSFVMQPPSGYYALCTKNLAEYG